MSRPVIARGMYGMMGPVTDPGERVFSDRVKALDPTRIDIGRSPYRDFDAGEIASDFVKAPPDAVRIVWGSSLGANNCPVVARYAQTVNIHGMWGFQASDYGAQWPILNNVFFAHEFYNPVWAMTMGLGHYRWTLNQGNTLTTLITTKKYDFHPGETEAVQQTVLAEIKRVIDAPGD